MKRMIEIKLYATLQAYAPPNASCYPIENDTSIETIVRALKIPMDHVKLIFANGVRCTMDTIVQDGDRVGLFPPVGGG